jgi:hypothetical protein
MIRILNARRPARPEEEEVSRALVTDALWAMVESCWTQNALMRPTAAAVVSQLVAMDPKPVALSEDLIQHLEALMRDGVAVQTALDILDRVRAQI